LQLSHPSATDSGLPASDVYPRSTTTRHIWHQRAD
jgi:hypothetical protein